MADGKRKTAVPHMGPGALFLLGLLADGTRHTATAVVETFRPNSHSLF